jgi:DNA mismatch repair protein MutS2
VRNASVEFDLASLRPTYRLAIGLPGRSNALAIAERLGLEGSVIEAARGLVAPQEIDAQDLLDEIQRTRDDTRREQAAARAEHDRLRQRQAELEERLAAIEQERKAALDEARQEGRQQIESLAAELDDLRRRLVAAGQPLEAIRGLREELEELAEEDQPEAIPPPVEERSLHTGERIRVASLGMDGTILQVGPAEVEVQIGRLRVRVGREELATPSEARERAPSMGEREPRGSTVILQPPPMEIDVRGHTADEALEAIERRLDAAYLAGLPFVRVIHGKGTGKLRQVIRQALRKNPYTASFETGSEAEGGEGVTIVRLAVG